MSDYIQKLINSKLADAGREDIFVLWNGDDEAPCFHVYLDEEKTDILLEERGPTIEIQRNPADRPRHYETLTYVYDFDALIAPLIESI